MYDDEEFDFATRRNKRLAKKSEEAKKAKLLKERLEHRARTLAESIRQADYCRPPLTVEPIGTSVKVQNGRGGILNIGVLDDRKYSVHASDSLIVHNGSKDRMMDLVDLWSEDKFPNDDDPDSST